MTCPSRVKQNVAHSREGILLKTIEGCRYTYCEFPLEPLDSDMFSWSWSPWKTGLQGSIGSEIKLVWYKNQKQLFAYRRTPENAVRIEIERQRPTPSHYIQAILDVLAQKA